MQEIFGLTMKHIFFKSSNGVLGSSLMSAVFLVIPNSPVSDDWLFRKAETIMSQMEAFKNQEYNLHSENLLICIYSKRICRIYLTTRFFEVNSLTSPGKRSPGSKMIISPGTTSV